MSPILMRPVREQLEHDRVIRLLQAKYKRKFEVAINPGAEQTTPVVVGPSPWYPDLVLQSMERGRKVLGVVEVETAESVNRVEAMSQWAAFGRLRYPFHLYIPASSIDVAKRLCLDLKIPVTEVWAYTAIGDQMRFTLVQRSSRTEEKSRAARAAAPARRPTTAGRRPGRPTARAARRPSTGGARRKTANAARGATGPKKASRSTRAQKRK